MICVNISMFYDRCKHKCYMIGVIIGVLYDMCKHKCYMIGLLYDRCLHRSVI